jgi:protein-L-isoaspartate(D-aspartate) O-methyltransferase
MIDFTEAREWMVVRQIAGRGIRDANVLSAMRRVPREEFVPAQLREYAYDDSALPIPSQQAISQPAVVAQMMEAAELGPHDRVLDVGTGSGYAAAIAAVIVAHVHSVERDPVLADTARETLARLGYSNVTVHLGDGTVGLDAYARLSRGPVVRVSRGRGVCNSRSVAGSSCRSGARLIISD